MASLQHLFQNRYTVTVIVFAVMSVLVGYKTIQTQTLPTQSLDANSIERAHHLVNGTPVSQLATDSKAHAKPLGYALTLAGLAKLNPQFRQTLSCTEPRFNCARSDFQFVVMVQYGIALLGLVAIFITAWTLSRSRNVALLTLILAFAAGSYGAIAGQMQPLVWSQSLMLVSLMCLTLAATRDDLKWTLSAGGTLGLTTLFLPQLIFVAVITALVMVLLCATRHLSLNHRYGHVLVFMVGFAAITATAYLSTTASWDPATALSDNLLALTTQRVALNRPGFQSWIAYILATPGVFMRGLWVGTPILTVLGLIHLPSLLKFSLEDARLGPTLLVAIPILALVVINTLVTVNRPEHNVGLVFLLTYATAYLIGRTEVRRKFWQDKKLAMEGS